MEHEQKLWELFGKELSGRLTDKERLEMEMLKKQFPDAARQYEMLGALQFRSRERQSQERNEELLGRIFAAAGDEPEPAVSEAFPEPPRRRRLWLAAVPLAAAVCAGIWFWTGQGQQEDKGWSTVQTRKGSKSKLTLPDGTEVILNAGSSLSYTEGFRDGARQVRLNGEGYFKVAKNAEHPFIVTTNDVEVRVLGTEFNLQAYDSESTTETTLISGKVEVTVKKDGKSYMLAPRQKLAVQRAPLEPAAVLPAATPGSDPGMPEVELRAADTDSRDSSLTAGAWVENRLVFNDEPLESLARRLERWYNVEVEIQDEALKQARFTGSVENEPVDQILEILTTIRPIKYKISATKIIIY
ncbi:FecR domain-containing protein [Chitinophaga sp.]|uniref:FecR family protein n=1 Tax=Chitinophaga sp. TaxID=1869181 RepID=UPI00262B9B7E|nr:FecR domain-containing protein [uncultured Chitinophaga sp.]